MENKNMNDKEYIPYIRKMVGHQKIISIGLALILIDKDGKVLLEKRTDNGKYCLPGGSINFDETVIEGLKREVKEETNLEVIDPKLLMILSGTKEEFVYPNGDVTDYVDLIFYEKTDKDVSSLLKCDSESSELFFCSLDTLPDESMMLRGTMRPLMKIKSGNFDLEID